MKYPRHTQSDEQTGMAAHPDGTIPDSGEPLRAMPVIVELLCPIHYDLEVVGKLESFHDCVACIRNERDKLRDVIAVKDSQIKSLRTINASLKAALAYSTKKGMGRAE